MVRDILKNKVENIVKRISHIIRDKEYENYRNLSFSQEGEDMIIDNIIGFKNQGFYVDLGALHPYRFSNTARFFLRGWHGINIDATPGSMEEFNKYRPKDVNLEVGIAEHEGVLIYYMFDEPALNTFDIESVKRLEKTHYKLKEKREVKTYCINDVLNTYLEEGQQIDILDIDIEGLDELVIRTLDFSKFCPQNILLENCHDDDSSATKLFLEEMGYKLLATTTRTAIWHFQGLTDTAKN